MTLVDVPYTCPIDGTKFTNKEMASATIFDRRLDLKRMGAIQEPPHIPVCPTDGFIVMNFTKDEIEGLKSWIQSEEYQSLWHSETPHFLLAKIYEKLGKDAYTIGEAYLKASWEAEKEPDRYHKYLRYSLEYFSRSLRDLSASDDKSSQDSQSGESKLSIELLTGEIERRLGLFDDAQKRFMSLRESAGVEKAFIKKVINFQLELIKNKDLDSHNLSEVDPPQANAGPDQTLECTSPKGTTATLDGSASSGSDDPLPWFTWTGPFPEGLGTVAREVSPKVTLALGTSTITLVVRRGLTDSAPKTVKITITVRPEGLQSPLAALVPEGSPVPLPDNPFKKGNTLFLKLKLYCGAIAVTDKDVSPPQIIELVRNGNAINLAIIDPRAGTGNNNALPFRFLNKEWGYELSTKGLSRGNYVITIKMPDGRHFSAGFVLI